jgi:hypothetical protein
LKATWAIYSRYCRAVARIQYKELKGVCNVMAEVRQSFRIQYKELKVFLFFSLRCVDVSEVKLGIQYKELKGGGVAVEKIRETGGEYNIKN